MTEDDRGSPRPAARGCDEPPDHDLTRLLRESAAGDAEAHERMFTAVYGELRRLASARMRGQRPDHTLQPTAVVHEAYLKLTGGPGEWRGREHFFATAARAMRQILINHARDRAAAKRGGGARPVTLGDLHVQVDAPDLDLLELDAALDELAAHDARLGQVVELRYFAGCGVEETAALLDVSPATVKRDWTYARAWLVDRLT